MNKDKSIIAYRKRLESKGPSALWDILKFRWHRRMLLRKINYTEFSRIRDKYKDASPDPGYSKYLDIQKWLPRNLWHAYILGLENQEPSAILDIGAGCGYFPFVCEGLGHKVTAVDMCDTAMFNELISLLKIDRTCYTIQAFTPLPGFRRKFDLVTAFMICFNNHMTNTVWGVPEWEFFLQDLVRNHTNPGAEAYFTLNPEADGRHYTPHLHSFFLQNGAEIDGERVYFPSLDKLR